MATYTIIYRVLIFRKIQESSAGKFPLHISLLHAPLMHVVRLAWKSCIWSLACLCKKNGIAVYLGPRAFGNHETRKRNLHKQCLNLRVRGQVYRDVFGLNFSSNSWTFTAPQIQCPCSSSPLSLKRSNAFQLKCLFDSLIGPGNQKKNIIFFIGFSTLNSKHFPVP